jgi:hypothetical protein
MISIAGIYILLNGAQPDPDYFSPSATFSVVASFPGSGNNILAVTSASNTILPGQLVLGANMPVGAAIMPYGTSGTTGTGGAGTYVLSIGGPPVVSETMQITISSFGLAGTGSLLFNTYDKKLYNRNASNTAWNLLGTTSNAYLGLLPRSGGALTSSVAGASGLLTADGQTPFIAPPYVISKNSRAATLADLNNLSQAISGQINTEVNASIQEIGAPSIKSNFAFGYGQIGTAGLGAVQWSTIPVTGMTYPDGTVVQPSDCFGFATIAGWGITGTGTNTPYTICAPKYGSNGMTWSAYIYPTPTGGYYTLVMNYIVIAIKPTA